MTPTLHIHRPTIKHRFRSFGQWLANLNRRPYLTAESFRRWGSDYGLPATDREYREALMTGLISPPPSND